MIQITKTGQIITATPDAVRQLRQEFDQQHCVILPGFLEPTLLEFLQGRLARGSFYERTHPNAGRELCLSPDFTEVFLHVLLNRPELFRQIQAITGCAEIGCVVGRVYRCVPGQAHLDTWHSDLIDHRLIAISINLSTTAYVGGLLQIRDQHSGRIMSEVANTGSGDAVIFRLAEPLQHRITEVSGSAAKTAFAGWFKAEPNFLSLLKADAKPL